MLTAFLTKLLQEGRGGQPVQVDHKITEMNFNNVSKILYGKSYYGLKTTNADGSIHAREFHEIADEWARVAGSVIVGDYLPWLRKLDIGGCEAHLLRLREEFNKFLTGVIEEHKRNSAAGGKGSRKEDFVDVLLSLHADEDGNTLSETQVKAFLQVCLLGLPTSSLFSRSSKNRFDSFRCVRKLLSHVAFHQFGCEMQALKATMLKMKFHGRETIVISRY